MTMLDEWSNVYETCFYKGFGGVWTLVDTSETVDQAWTLIVKY